MMLVVLLVAAAAQPVESPKVYVERLYANYRHSDYSPFKHPERVFAPRLLSAINEDSNLSHGEVGYLDGDPVCQCQDADGLHASVKGVTRQGRDSAAVSVQLDFVDSTPTHVRISLLRTRAGWRIADVSAPDEPSLLRALEVSNRKARARR
jgi:hypothetical protein